MNDDIMNEIIKLAPPFAGVDPTLLNAWVEMAMMFVCRDRFGDDYNKAVALYTLHLMTLDGAMKQQGESVSAYSQRVASFSLTGEFSKTYATTNTNQGGRVIDQTPFGKIFSLLNKRKGGGWGLITAARGCFR